MDSDQRRAAETTHSCVLVSACPGSGKTRVLMRRAVRLATEGYAVTCVSFTNQAAEEIRRRLTNEFASLDDVADVPECATLHAMAKTRLEAAGVEVRLLDAEEQRDLLAAAAEVDNRTAEAALRAYGLAASRVRRVFPAEFADALEAYAAEKRKRGSMDFEDLLERFHRYVAEEHPDCRMPDHLLVDEFQDMSELQIDILRRMRARGTHIFAVGDRNQAIYAFRGATHNSMDNFAALIGGGDVEPLRLSCNYRSSTPIVRLCAAHARVPMRSNEGSQMGRLPVELHVFQDSADEVAWLLARTKAVVLFRTNSQMRAFEADMLVKSGETPKVLGMTSILQSDVVARVAECQDWPPRPDAVCSSLEELKTCRPFVRCVARLPAEEARQILRKRIAKRGDATEGSSKWLLGTVHQAKGMEWDEVYLPHMAEGQFPLQVRTDEESEEERRIFFVAASRAMSRLVLSCHGERVSSFVRAMNAQEMRIVDHRGGAAPPQKKPAPPPSVTYHRKRKASSALPDPASMFRGDT